MAYTATFNNFSLGEFISFEDLDFDYSRDILNDRIARKDGIETRNLGGGEFTFTITVSKTNFANLLEKLDFLKTLPANLGTAKADLKITHNTQTRTFSNLLCTGFRLAENQKTYIKLQITFLGTAL